MLVSFVKSLFVFLHKCHVMPSAETVVRRRRQLLVETRVTFQLTGHLYDSEPVVAIHISIVEIGAIVFSCGCNCSDSLLMADI